jgi:hypothetical protein
VTPLFLISLITAFDPFAIPARIISGAGIHPGALESRLALLQLLDPRSLVRVGLSLCTIIHGIYDIIISV